MSETIDAEWNDPFTGVDRLMRRIVSVLRGKSVTDTLIAPTGMVHDYVRMAAYFRPCVNITPYGVGQFPFSPRHNWTAFAARH